MKDSVVKNGEIKKLMIGIDVIFKQIDILFKAVQDSNQNTIALFKNSMFSNYSI